jgi:hypothetical protein
VFQIQPSSLVASGMARDKPHIGVTGTNRSPRFGEENGKSRVLVYRSDSMKCCLATWMLANAEVEAW